MAILGVHHLSFIVTDLDNTINFYTLLLGAQMQSKTRNSYETLGMSLLGHQWGVIKIHEPFKIAVARVSGYLIEFIQYINPNFSPFHKNPIYAGSVHITFKVDDIVKEMARLKAAGVEFHSPINVFKETGKPEWKWCYFRDPDGICLELVEHLDY